MMPTWATKAQIQNRLVEEQLSLNSKYAQIDR